MSFQIRAGLRPSILLDWEGSDASNVVILVFCRVKYKVGPLPVITGFITPITRVIRTVSHL